MSILDSIICNCGVKNLIANLLLRSTCDIIRLDEAFQPRICIYKSKRKCCLLIKIKQITLAYLSIMLS